MTPIFYNCWNQNIITQFQTEDGACWFATFGKHSKNFPVYGASYDNLMLYDASMATGYGLSEDVLPQLFFQWKKDIFRLGFKGDVSVFKDSLEPVAKSPFDISLEFKTIPVGKNLLFLKRILPFSNRFIPGAVFQNQILVPGDNDGHLQLGNKKLGIVPKSLRGHLENGASSFINSWIWNIVYRYLGVLSSSDEETRFYYNWKLYPLAERSFLDKPVNIIKRKINKEVLVTHKISNGAVMHQDPAAISVSSRSFKELFKIPSAIASFNFTRSFIEVKDNQNNLWHGILEDFKHPEILDK